MTRISAPISSFSKPYGAISDWFGLVISVTSPKSGDGRC